jgi:hypothetical protein
MARERALWLYCLDTAPMTFSSSLQSIVIVNSLIKEIASKMQPSSQLKLAPQQAALAVFRDYLIEPSQMLCFHGRLLDENRDSLRCLTEQGLLSKEEFKGGYTLTKAGFAAIQSIASTTFA